ncbi:MAG: hypothetical protein DSZ07_01020 [Sulfurovum sp.]|nr:MAG: hypothetical protein DSZ07_01020 [Sulfurovum sp.]
MKFIISKCFTLGSVMLVILTSSVYAGASKVDKEDVIPKIKAEDISKKNKKLKEGKACNFDDLEEAEGEEFTEIPMAQSIPCADVDCKNLKPAVLHDDNYKKLPDTETIKGCD